MNFRAIEIEITDPISPREALRRLQGFPYPLLLESSVRHDTLGRYSFVAIDPVETLSVPVGSAQPLEPIRRSLHALATPSIGGRPPFQGGWAGCLSYELGMSFERIPRPSNRAIAVPAICLGLYDVVIAWDHVEQRTWLFSQGIPEIQESRRTRRAQARAKQILASLRIEPNRSSVSDTSPTRLANICDPPAGFRKISEQLLSNFSAEEYLSAVRRCVDYIRAGDVFQVNLSQQLLVPAHVSSLDLYERLAEGNPSTFAGYFNPGPFQIISSSPERLLQIKDRRVESRPIKGTRRRTKDAVTDADTVDEFRRDEKERAENTMIVDLIRNDFSRICREDSVLVSQWCDVEPYETVFHLVSAVEGHLCPEADAIDAITAVFPGGSVTGAPKIRAMEIISELEKFSRGAYCGSLGYFSLGGDADFNILIRTVTQQNGWWQIPVGGGVVAPSIPQREYQETWTKAAALLAACGVREIPTLDLHPQGDNNHPEVADDSSTATITPRCRECQRIP